MEEIWREVTDSNGDYEVSNKGRVRSWKQGEPYVLSQYELNSGYLVVSLNLYGKKRNYLVHRVVAREFCEGFEEGKVVNHKDANRHNNSSDNLEWCTTKENIQDCIRRGTHDVKSAHKVAHVKRRRPVVQLTSEGEEVARYKSAREAAKAVGVHENCISRVCRGERKLTAGFSFRYLDSR